MNRYNFNNLKNLIPVNSMAVVISILALFVAVSSGNTPCLSADSVCSSGVDPEYTNNLSVKAGTTNKATITHNNLNGDNQYFFPESNYSRTSSVAVLKKGSDQLNILDLQNGSIIVGQSQTTTVGALRVQTSSLPVLQLYGSAGWQDVGASTPQNVFTTISGNSGSLTASTTTTSIKLEASADSGLTVVASGDKLEIQSSGASGGTAMEFFAYINASYTNTNNLYHFDTEYYDTSNCFTLSGTPNYTITYTCADTRVFTVFTRVEVQGNGNARTIIDVYVNSTFMGGTISQPRGSTVDQASSVFTGAICLNQNDVLYFGGNTNSGTVYGSSTYPHYSNVQMIEKLVFGTSQSCTNGSIN